MQYSLVLTDEVDESVRRAVLAPLADYNILQAGPSGNLPLAVLIKDEGGQIVGELWGNTGYEWLFTQLLVVPEDSRGKGVGSEVMRLAEQEALRRGCHSSWLDTFEFQARGFYERLGYTCFGELANYPTGHVRFFMQKRLAVQPSAT